MKSTAGRGELNCVSSFAIFDDISINYRKSKADYLMGSVPGMVTAKNLSETNRRKRVLAPEKWQRIKIVVKGQRVEHWLNAVKVADFAACDGQENKTAENGNIQIQLENGTLNLSTIKYRPD